jgi:hypothetical protein
VNFATPPDDDEVVEPPLELVVEPPLELVLDEDVTGSSPPQAGTTAAAITRGMVSA